MLWLTVCSEKLSEFEHIAKPKEPTSRVNESLPPKKKHLLSLSSRSSKRPPSPYKSHQNQSKRMIDKSTPDNSKSQRPYFLVWSTMFFDALVSKATFFFRQVIAFKFLLISQHNFCLSYKVITHLQTQFVSSQSLSVGHDFTRYTRSLSLDFWTITQV